MLSRILSFTILLFTHLLVDLEFNSLRVNDLCIFTPNPGNKNVEIQVDPDNKEIGFDVCG